jgi:hypothetical protein
MLMISDEELKQHFTVDISTKKLSPYNLPLKLFSQANKATRITFEKGSQGCFHSNDSLKTFIITNNQFLLSKNSTLGFLTKMTKQLNVSSINHLINLVDSSRYQKLTLTDFGFTKTDISNFKDFITKQEQKIKKNGFQRVFQDQYYCFPGAKTDFEFYRNIADTVLKLSDEKLTQIFSSTSGNHSTTTDTRRVLIIFQDGKKLSVENIDDNPNYLATPWTVNYEGLKFKINSIQFGKLVNELTKGGFFETPLKEKNYALFKIADYLYPQKIGNTL